MDLRTTYLGFELPHPVIVGASPICDDLDLVRRAVDAGAAAIVMHSLFEEQIELENATHEAIGLHGDSFAEAGSYLPTPHDYVLGPDAYLEQIRKLKSEVGVPVIASLNGVTDSGWLHYARLIQEAGADALELNVYSNALTLRESALAIEDRVVRMVQQVVTETPLPIAVKLSPFWTSFGHLATRIESSGAKGLVLFNRFYQPDIDPERLEVALTLKLSSPSELLLRLRWLAQLSGRTTLSLSCSGGAHTANDVLKAVLAGAHSVQMVSALLQRGPEHIAKVTNDLARWLGDHEYQSLRQAQGSLNLVHTPHPEVYERGNYLKILQGYARSML
ncbi:MAG: dihydroorotate dehydrogenase-like protein [Planctomycetes bacterium]|nr:dihydroorotate dehydrogenase-like protein [Planctomycetota bacterium]